MISNSHPPRGGKSRVLVLTPVLPPAPGGGAIYTPLLVNGLLDRGYAEFAAVLTEKHPEMPGKEELRNGSIVFLRRYPFRAGVLKKDIWRYFRYLVQNLQFLDIPLAVRKYRITHVLIHGSFHNNPNLMWLAVRLTRLISPATKLVLDARDPKLPRSKIGQLRPYWKVICCSENVVRHFEDLLGLTERLVHIPVIIDVIKPTKAEIEDCQKRYGLAARPYIFNGSGIYLDKGTDRLWGVVEELRKEMPQLNLVIAGRKRDWSPSYDQAVEAGWLKYVGAIPHRDVLLLSAGAMADVNLSRVDSMPRASLEALACGARVLLPQGVPEFERACPGSIMVSNDLEQIALQVQKIMRGETVAEYDITPHLSARVLQAYGELLG